MGERPTQDTPIPDKRRPPPGALLLPPQRAKPARNSARCGAGEGPPGPQPPHPQPVGTGRRPHAPRMGGRARESARPRTPHTQARGVPPPGRPPASPTAHKASPQERALCGWRRLPTPGPMQPQRVGSRPRPHARRTDSQEWESAQPRTPHTKVRSALPLGALVPPTQRPKPARKSARCAVFDGSPRPHLLHPQPVYSGSRPHALRSGGGAWESAKPRKPHTQARDAPPPRGTHVLPPQRAKPARKSARCGICDGSPRPHPPHPQTFGSGPRLHVPRTSSRTRKSSEPRTPHTQARDTTRAPLCRPHSAQSKLARARAVGMMTGPHTHIPPAATASG